jgi:hypothetical protein
LDFRRFISGWRQANRSGRGGRQSDGLGLRFNKFGRQLDANYRAEHKLGFRGFFG